MGLKITILLCIALSVVHNVHGLVWEFGADNIPVAGIITNFIGHFDYPDKERNVKILVPPCQIVTYVRVQVDNLATSPNVYYNSVTQMVSIQYQPWQYSQSDFFVLAKSVLNPHCLQQPLK